MTSNLTTESTSIQDIVCLSHLRWNWVFQRPQHLLTRGAKERRVLFFEEPIFDANDEAFLDCSSPHANVTVATPHLPRNIDGVASEEMLRTLLNTILERHAVRRYILWYYTPMALPFSRHLSPQITVYDCMDQLAGFAGASPEIFALERELLDRCDLLFTGGLSLYEAKRKGHSNAHCFPSSVDVAHFRQAREKTTDPKDQKAVPHPRIGYVGVIDERVDRDLIAEVARVRSDWHIILIGPVAKIDMRSLPLAPNILYLGPKSYQELPAYISGWDVAWLPFARNEATRFISPTKTPEYLAAGKPVVSTSIRDVVRTYGHQDYVWIADSTADTIRGVEACLRDDNRAVRLAKVDEFLSHQSWDETWQRMESLISEVTARMHGVKSACTII